MSLNDRYHRNDGFLSRVDASLTRLGDRAGNYWLERTGVSRSILTYCLFMFAGGVALQKLTLFRDPFDMLIVLLATMGILGLSRSRGGVVEQIQAQAMGLPKNTLIFVRLLLLLAGLMGLANATGYILVSIQTQTPFPATGIDSLMNGIMLTVLQASEYIQRTNPSPPSRGLPQWVRGGS
jgi:hypothetical protein